MLPLSCHFQQRAICGDVVSDALCRPSPLAMLLRHPFLLHALTLLPTTPVWRVSGDGHPRYLLPCLQFFGYFNPYSLPAWTVIEPVLLRGSLPHPWHSFLSDHPMSYNRFCTHPPSITRFLITVRCFSVAPHIQARLPTSSNRTFLACCRSIFFTFCGYTALMSTSTSS